MAMPTRVEQRKALRHLDHALTDLLLARATLTRMDQHEDAAELGEAAKTLRAVADGLESHLALPGR